MNWWEARLKEASYAGDYRVHVRYANALEADVDLSDLLDHQFYASLKGKERFAQVKGDAELPILVWPGDIDLAPEILFERTIQAAGKIL